MKQMFRMLTKMLHETFVATDVTCVIVHPGGSEAGFAGTVAFALRTKVVSQHGTQDEVFLGRQPVQRFVDHAGNGMDAFGFAEEQINLRFVNRAYQIGNVLALQACHGKGLVPPVDGIEHHLAHAFLELVNVVEENLQITGVHVGRESHISTTG